MNEDLLFFFEQLNRPENNIIVLIVFICAFVIVQVLRLITCASYQTHLTIFNFSAKEVKVKSEIKDTKCNILNKSVKEYIKFGEKGLSYIDTKSISYKNVLHLSFLGWNLNSMSNLIEAFEKGFIWIGILLTIVFEYYRIVYSITTVASFILTGLFSSIFDYKLVREKLIENLTEYLNCQIGQFYANDLNVSVSNLKNEISDSILKQSENIGNSIKKMGLDLSGVLQLSVQEMSRSIEKTVTKISDIDLILQQPLEKWKTAIESATNIQNKINESFENLKGIVDNFKNASNTLEVSLYSNSQKVLEQNEKISECINELISVTKNLQLNSESTATINQSISKQLDYVEKNQLILEDTLCKYEASIENLTLKMGDGLGKILDYHIQSAYNSLNENLKDNIMRIVNTNNELVSRLQKLFENLAEQNRIETQAILKMKEQINIT